MLIPETPEGYSTLNGLVVNAVSSPPKGPKGPFKIQAGKLLPLECVVLILLLAILILLNIIKAKVKDPRFIDLIRKSLKAGYFEFQTYSHTLVGTPQGSIISPLLANIYMHKLDEFVLKLKAQFDLGTKASVNPD